MNNKFSKKASQNFPRVSVIIPCYNQGQFLDEAVESVLNQTFDDFEIIVVNDGSTDPYTIELFKDYRRPKTTVFTTENLGLAATRNYATRRSRGEYILPLDADDKLAPQFLEKCVCALDQKPQVGFVYSYLKFFGREDGGWSWEQFDERKLLLGNIVCHSSMMRRKAFDEVGGFNTNMKLGYEDWDFWIGMVEKGWRGYRIPEHLFYYRKRPGTMVTTANLPHNRVRLVSQICRNHPKIYSDNLPHVISEKEKIILKQDAYIKLLEKRLQEREETIGQRDEMYPGLFNPPLDKTLGVLIGSGLRIVYWLSCLWRGLRRKPVLDPGTATTPASETETISLPETATDPLPEMVATEVKEPPIVKPHEPSPHVMPKPLKLARSKPKIAYIVSTLGICGKVAVACQHCNRLLKRGYDVSLVDNDLLEFYTLDWFPDQQVKVLSVEEVQGDFDVAVATDWNTTYNLPHFPARRKYYFVQADESRFFSDDKELIEKIRETYTFDFNYITETKWNQRWLKETFGKKAHLVPNGLDHTVFHPAEPLEPKGDRVRVLLEGAINLRYKNMCEAFEIVRELDCEVWCVSADGKPAAAWRCDRFFEYVPMNQMKHIHSSCDILLKLSSAEGNFSSPLEMMACGGACVVSRVSGWDEHLVDGYNALTVEIDDFDGAKAAIKSLIEDGQLRQELIKGGMKTAAGWDWEPSIDLLEKIYTQ